MKVEVLELLKNVVPAAVVGITALLRVQAKSVKMEAAIKDLRSDYEKDIVLIRGDMKDDRERTEKFENRLYGKLDKLDAKMDSFIIAKQQLN